MKKENVKYLVGSIIFVTFAALSLIFIFSKFKDSSSVGFLKLLEPKYILLIMGVLIPFYLFDGLRLYFVFKTIGKSVNFLLILKLVFINIFASGVTPLATGGGFAQIYFLNKNKIPVGIATAATSIRTGLASLIIFAFVPVILLLEKGVQDVIPVKHGIIFSILLISFYIFLFISLVKFKGLLKKIIFVILNFLSRIKMIKEDKCNSIKSSFDREISHFSDSLLKFKNGNKLYLFLSILTEIIYLLILFILPFILIKSMGLTSNMITILSFQVLITFLLYFSPTPGGSGIAEGGFALIFSSLVARSYVAPLTFYWRFLTSYLGMIIGVIIFYREIWRKKNVSKQ